MQCKTCKNRSSICEEFITLPLAIQKVQSLSQSIEEFLKDEIIQDYMCEKCQKRRAAVKRTRISRLPRYLIFHLKRFKYFPKTNKITHPVKFE